MLVQSNGIAMLGRQIVSCDKDTVFSNWLVGGKLDREPSMSSYEGELERFVE